MSLKILLNGKDVSLDVSKITVRNNTGTSLSSTQLKSMITSKEYEIEYEGGDKEIIKVEITNGKELFSVSNEPMIDENGSIWISSK